MTEWDARDASPIGLAVNSTGRVVTALLWDKTRQELPVEGAYERLPGSGLWKRSPLNHGLYVGVDPNAWEPQNEWPEGWPS